MNSIRPTPLGWQKPILGLLIFAAVACLGGSGYLFWSLASSPAALGPFTYVSPEQEPYYGSFLVVRQSAFAFFGLSLALAGLFFFLRWFWRRAPARRGGPRQQLAFLLGAARDLLARPSNDFTWSHWPSAAEALAEIDALLASLSGPTLPERTAYQQLFESNGHLQNLSVSSGWTPEYVPLGERFDAIASRLWPEQ